jgi:hypothetical protein
MLLQGDLRRRSDPPHIAAASSGSTMGSVTWRTVHTRRSVGSHCSRCPALRLVCHCGHSGRVGIRPPGLARRPGTGLLAAALARDPAAARGATYASGHDVVHRTSDDLAVQCCLGVWRSLRRPWPGFQVRPVVAHLRVLVLLAPPRPVSRCIPHSWLAAARVVSLFVWGCQRLSHGNAVPAGPRAPRAVRSPSPNPDPAPASAG